MKKKIAALMLSVFMLTTLATQTASAAFSDVPDDHPYKTAIDFCEAKGFVGGIGGGLFAPGENLTRLQLALVWCRFLQADTKNHTFSDVTPLKNSYDTAAIIMSSYGILTGTSGARFSPYTSLTREQLAVVVRRATGIGVADKDDYKAYSDHALISAWAQAGVSACLNAGIFSGLYTEPELQPQKAVTRAEICQLLYNLSLPAYTITIAELTGGTITALPMVARPGTTITLTVTPDKG
ncbi:MAG: S-layer homology domain-containing protein, partial [Clostridiales bacterium]|nr:S-layer homology domain-containing protein [Clostridiales bacterium]